MSVVACCDAKGCLIPAASIVRGKTKIRIGKIHSLMELKYSWMQNPDMSVLLHSCGVERTFYPTSTTRDNDGAAAYCTYRAVLNLVQENYAVVVCLPCHSANYFQPQIGISLYLWMFFPPRHCACGHNSPTQEVARTLWHHYWRKLHRKLLPGSVLTVHFKFFRVWGCLDSSSAHTLQNCPTRYVTAVCQELNQMDVHPPHCLNQRKTLLNGFF